MAIHSHHGFAGLASRRGASLIEILVSIVLISGVGITVAEVLHKNTQNIIWNRQTRRASMLADMVIEKYDYLSSVNFATLEQFNKSNVAVSSFFSSPDADKGYENMRITTLTDLPGPDGSRKLTITVTWGSGANQRFVLTKYFSPTTGDKGGAPIYVTVLDPAGNGVAGFEVRAAHHFNPTYRNSVGTNEVIATTDGDGHAVLHDVAIDGALQPIAVYARKSGSDTAIPRSDPRYVSGYYVAPSEVWNTKTVRVTQTSVNSVAFDMRDNDFIPLGRIAGHVNNAYGPNAQLAVSFQGLGVSALGTATSATWQVATADDGTFEFNNVLPGATVVSVHGKRGSDITVSPGTVAFEQGFVGFHGTGVDPWDYLVTIANPPTPIENFQTYVRPLGSLDFTLTTAAHLPMANTAVTMELPEIGFGDRGIWWYGGTDPSGKIRLFNVYARDAQSIQFSATDIPSTGCPDNGYYLHRDLANVSANQTNTVTLAMREGYTLTGTITDGATPPNILSNIGVTATRLDGYATGTTSDASGSFTLCGLSSDANTNYRWPQVSLLFSDPSGHISATFQGSVWDKDSPSVRIPGVPIVAGAYGVMHNVACASDPNPSSTTSDAIVSDSNGNYGPICVYYEVGMWQWVTVSGGPTIYSAGSIPADMTSVSGVGLMTQYYPYATQSVGQTMVNGQTYNGGVPVRLVRQLIQGTVRDSALSTPLQGITLNPCEYCPAGESTSCPVTTDAAGHYGPAWTCLYERSDTNPGRVRINMLDGSTAQNTGAAYNGATATQGLVYAATPTVPLTLNLSGNRKGGGI